MANKRHPDGYWSEERIISVAQNYDFKSDFRKNEPTAYNKARYLGILSKVTEHMKEIHKKKPGGYWIKERCVAKAIELGALSELSKHGNGAYQAIKRNGWLDEIRTIIGRRKPLTKEECQEIANGFKNSRAWEKGHKRSFMTAKRNGWLEELRAHMWPIVRYTKEDCARLALNFDYRVDFLRGAAGAYQCARKNKWLEEICKHMKPKGNLKKRIFYAFEFDDGCAYVGLTYSVKTRYNQHTATDCNSPVFRHIQNGHNFKFKIISEWMDETEASEKEDSMIEKHRAKGWKMLNTAKGGGLGGSHGFITKDLCIETAKGYEYKGDFISDHESMYVVACREGWWPEVCKNLKNKPNKGNLKWTHDLLVAAVEKCNHKKGVMYDTMPGAYGYLLEHGLVDKYFGYSGRYDRQNAIEWTDKNLRKVVKGCKGRMELRKKCGSAYNFLYRKGRLDEFFPPKETPAYYTIEGAQALIYEKGITSLAQLFKKEHRIYDYARRHGWREQLKFCSKEIPQHHTIEGIKAFIMENGITTRTSLNNVSSMMYAYARVHGWLDQLLPPREEPAYHTFEGMQALIKELGVTRRTQFCRAANSPYQYARIHGWLDRLFPLTDKKNK